MRWSLAAAIAAMSVGLVSVAHADNFTIDPHHTQIIFAIKHQGLSTFYGRFGKVSGTLVFDDAAPEKSQLNAQVDMTDIETHVDELDKELQNTFRTSKYPTANFTARQIVKTGENTGTATGDLTLAGVTKPVTLNVTFNGGKHPMIVQPYRVGFDATTTVKRSDFGLTGMIWSGFVADEVTLMIECEAERQ
ncbi:MAG: polyisoprenoid-binding protein [Proteobacteria bacterium]|nr:polyisoprenoid-binding protein [Pseudomonadota bacterium]